MTWAFPDESTPENEAILARLAHDSAVVPSLWFVEVANVLTLAERKGRLTNTSIVSFLDLVRNLRLDVDGEGCIRALDCVLPLCREHKLTSYDALYLEIAMRRSLPLATLDTDLKKAAKRVGVKTL